MFKQPAVYILASKRNGTLYIGVTSDLPKRAWEHKNDLVEGFTKRYKVHRLFYYELHGDMETAIKREKQMRNGTGRGSWNCLRSRIRIGGICGRRFFKVGVPLCLMCAAGFPLSRE